MKPERPKTWRDMVDMEDVKEQYLLDK
jgi:hypothetical protein